MKKINQADIIRNPNKYLIGNSFLIKVEHKNDADEVTHIEYSCSDCTQEVKQVAVEYSRKGDKKGTVSKEITAYFCQTCNKYSLSDYWVPQINSLADSTEEKLKILPELGINSDKELEIFCDIRRNQEEFKYDMCVEEFGMKISIGDQSPLFSEALNLTTDYDTSDYGHDLSKTLKISPGLPYSQDQRKNLTVLIAKLQMQINDSLIFWTMNFKDNFIEHETEIEIYNDLCDLLLEWDHDRAALSILNDIYSGNGPGDFINVFRLLEYVLDICLLRDIKKIRFDTRHSNDSFSELTKEFQFDLRTKLKRRIDGLKIRPTDVLHDLWQRLCFNESYNETQVCAKIVDFRNKLAHKPDKNAKILLPWEEPSLTGFVHEMLRLIHSIIYDN